MLGEKKTNPVETVLEPPDSGWAWVVLVGAFMTHFTVIGFLSSVSVYVFVWIQYFNGSAAETSLVVTLCAFMAGALCPIAGAISTRIGLRPTAMAGGVVVSAGMLVSSQSTNIIFLIFSLGLLAAFGISIAFTTTFAVLGRYFKKRLALAMGITTAGASIGQLAFPPLYQYLIDEYGWRGSLMIVAALTFHAVAAGALFRPLTTPKVKRSSKKGPKRRNIVNLEVKKSKQDQGGIKDFETADTCRADGLSFLNPSILGGENFTLSKSGTSLGHGSIFEAEPGVTMTADVPEDDDRIEYADSWSLSSDATEEGDFTIITNNLWIPFAVTTTADPHTKKHRPSIFHRKPRSASMLSQTLVKTPSVFLRLVRNPSFVILLVIAMAHGFSLASTTYHMVSRAESVNIDPDNAALLLTITGGGNFVGRINIGWIVDKGYLRPETGYSLSFTICALATLITPLVTEFGVLAAVAVVHGLSFGASTVIIVMFPRLVVKPSLATTATSFMLLSWGVGEISGGALAGWYYDALESYDYSFYTAGSLMTAGAALMLAIYCLRRAKERRQGPRYKSSGMNDGPLQSDLGHVDPELVGSSTEDLGRVNPIFFMKGRFQSENDSCRNEWVDENARGWGGSESTDLQREAGSSYRDDTAGKEGDGLDSFNRKGEPVGSDSAEESLRFENQINAYDAATKIDPSHGSGCANHMGKETYGGCADEDVREISRTTTDSPQISPDLNTEEKSNEKAVEGNGAAGEFEMGFENPGYAYDNEASIAAIRETESMDRSHIDSESIGDAQAEVVLDSLSEQSGESDDLGIENPTYFSWSRRAEYPGSGKAICESYDTYETCDNPTEDKTANGSELGLTNPCYFLNSDNTECITDHANTESTPTDKNELGITNPNYSASSQITEYCASNSVKDRFAHARSEDSGYKSKDEHDLGVSNAGYCDGNQPDCETEEIFL